jgi:hypothetical protein
MHVSELASIRQQVFEVMSIGIGSGPRIGIQKGL